jgi:uncharacterized protein YcnI
MLRRLTVLIAAVVALLGASASPALAHTELEPEEAVAGSTEVLTFHVAYEGSATTGLEVQLPEGATVVSVPAKAGWESAKDDAQRTVSWTGGPVEADEEFQVEVELPDTTGEVLFPSIQHTSDGEVEWISPEEGEGEGTFPAPRMTLTADPNATTTTTAGTTTTDDLPGTTVEAANEGDGDSAAPWLIGAGIAAIVAIAVGGYLLKRHMDRSEADGTEPPAPEGSGGG